MIFEVEPKPERFADYLELAKFLRPKLLEVDGFLDNERFASQRTEGRLLSLSSWRDEEALVRWRSQGDHHLVQAKGRAEIFADYHLRVGAVYSDSAAASANPAAAKPDAKIVTITEWLAQRKDATAPAAADIGLAQDAPGLATQDIFESLTTPGKFLCLASWRDPAAAGNFVPQAATPDTLRHRCVRILRDYGMRDRAEAPQHFPEAPLPTPPALG